MPPPIAMLVDYYRDFYKVIRYDPEKVDWPPNLIKLSVNVTLIHHKNGRTQQELLEIAKRHEEGAAAVDDAATFEPDTKRPRLFKQAKTLDNVFAADCVLQGENTTVSPRRVLIEGAPGIGKTVLAKEIAFLWSKGKLLREVTVLFLLFLRDPKLWEVTTVKELVQYLLIDIVHGDENVVNYTQIFLHSKTFQMAFVFDGLDEFPQDKNPFILKVIFGQVFPKAIIVCTSRPVASLCLHDHVDRRIEILGFTKEEREKYITLSLLDSPDKKEQLEKYLKDNPMIDDLCHIPLHLAILMFLYKQGILPETLTELNELFICHSIYRNLKRAHGHDTVNTVIKLTNLPLKEQNVINKLSKLAYLGKLSHCLVFTSDEIKQICPEIFDMPEAANGFGLLKAVSHYPKTGAGTTTSFIFLHLTMQEFLAAVHVSKLSVNEQLTLLDQTFWNGLFQYMWIMYIGTVGINSRAFVRFIDSYFEDSVFWYDDELDEIKCLHLFQCYTEAKAVEMPNIISSLFKNGVITFHNVSFFQHNFLSVMSFLSKSNLQCKALTFNQCRVFGKNIMSTLKWFVINNTDKISTLKYINLCNNHSHTSSWIVFCVVIKYSLVEDLTLCGAFGAEEYFKEINESVQCNTTLKSLTLCATALSDVERIKDILMETNSSVNVLNISIRTITPGKLNMSDNVLISTKMKRVDDDTRVLTLNVLHENVLNNSNSETLDVSFQTIKDHEMFYIIFGLQYNTTIKVLNVSHNQFTDNGVTAIRDYMFNSSVITELNISSNDISIKPIAEILVRNSSLLKLDISNTCINDNEAEIICGALKVNKTLQELNISRGHISPAGGHFIAEGLCENTSLQKLDISTNKILDDGAIAICNCLKTNSNLQELNLSFNKITNRGVKEIKQLKGALVCVN